jgi:hypothetical protein
MKQEINQQGVKVLRKMSISLLEKARLIHLSFSFQQSNLLLLYIFMFVLSILFLESLINSFNFVSMDDSSSEIDDGI